MKRYAQEQPTTFSLLIPDAGKSAGTDWTLEVALPLLERAARGPVAALTGDSEHPMRAIRDVVADDRYDRILISTLPRHASQWLRRDLPKRVKALGVPVEVITPKRQSVRDVVNEAARHRVLPRGPACGALIGLAVRGWTR